MMNKKLMAAAVAGAFVAPAVSLAQTSTVQLYGRATVEYTYVDQGAGRPNTDVFQTPGGSSVGVRGEEKLGGGMSAWFQCESSAGVDTGGDGFCTRNSAIGLKGAWGNLHFGRWDTPFKRATVGMVGAGDTGVFGAAATFSGNSTGSVASGGQDPDRNVWKRREGSSINYASPSFGGFQVLAAYSSANATAATNATTNAKPRVLSIAGIYKGGPLQVGLGYEKHQDNSTTGNVGSAAVAAKGGTVTVTALTGAVPTLTASITGLTLPTSASAATAGTGFDDRGWTIGASYTFAGKIEIGAQYIDTKYEMANGTELKKKNWMIGAEWNIAGPHNLDIAYVDAGDSKGNSAQGISGGNGPIAASGSDTGAKFFTIAYRHTLSKRTWFKLGYAQVDNDSRANYSLGGLRGNPGEKQSGWGMYAQHSW